MGYVSVFYKPRWRDGEKGLRSLKPKAPKPTRTNAQQCAEYKQRLKKDPDKYDMYLKKQKALAQSWRARRTEEKKMEDREAARIRKQLSRARQKEQAKKNSGHQSCFQGVIKGLKTSRPKTRADTEKKEEERRKARERKRKSRANRSIKKKASDNKKRMDRYYKKKENEKLSRVKAFTDVSKGDRRNTGYLMTLNKKSLKNLSKKRDKQSLTKLAAIKEILKKSQVMSWAKTQYYKRQKVSDRTIEDFCEKEAIDFPGKKTVGHYSMKQKKVLTRRIEDLYADFRNKNPSFKISLTTFARQRPSHILLSSSRAFLQCLCEKCENPMLKTKVLNVYLKVKIRQVGHLVEQTLSGYKEFHRNCVDRKCDACGVEKVITGWKLELEGKLQDQVKWTRWEQSGKSGKTLVEKDGSLEDLIKELQAEMKDLAKHLKTAKWQRQQYQNLLSSLPYRTAVITSDFAENYTCKFQNEMQSSHWSYNQISIHPCVLQYKCQDEGCDEAVTEYIVFISDDLRHDAAFEKTVMEQLLRHLKEISITKATEDWCKSTSWFKLDSFSLGQSNQTNHGSQQNSSPVRL